MSELLNKLAAIIEWCEKHGADEPHRLACEAREIIEAMQDHDNPIHPDQAVS
jgi:ribosomal protein S12 methylthiotransferase accessory factor YcaO